MWRLAKSATQNMPAIVTDSDDTIIAICPPYSTYTKGSPSYQERNKTAYLIAAAPELLQATEDLMASYREFVAEPDGMGNSSDLTHDSFYQNVLLIIAQAKGETTS